MWVQDWEDVHGHNQTKHCLPIHLDESSSMENTKYNKSIIGTATIQSLAQVDLINKIVTILFTNYNLTTQGYYCIVIEGKVSMKAQEVLERHVTRVEVKELFKNSVCISLGGRHASWDGDVYYCYLS